MLRIVLAVLLLAAATNPSEARRLAKRQNVMQILSNVASEVGLPLRLFLRIGQIESGLRPDARTGSYKGLFQLSNDEFKRHGGKGSIYDATENAKAFGRLLKDNIKQFRQSTGRNPTATDIYLMHQQGTAGQTEHAKDPDRLAWQAMYATGEGQRKGPKWAKAAIWGNLPKRDRKRFKSVNNVTSGDFIKAWEARVENTDFRDMSPRDVKTAMSSPGNQSRTGRIGSATSQSVSLPVQTALDAPALSSKPSPQVRSLAQGDPSPGAPTEPPVDLPLIPASAEPTPRPRRLSQGLAPQSSSDDDQVFGKPFGELYGRPDQGDNIVPPTPPLFRDFFG